LYKGIKSHHHFVSNNEEEEHEEGANQRENEEEGGDNNTNNTTKNTEHKSGPKGLGFFQRFRVCHDIVRDPQRYFNLKTLNSNEDDFDPSGGGDPVRSIGQYDYKNLESLASSDNVDDNDHQSEEGGGGENYKVTTSIRKIVGTEFLTGPLWLRFEPFILHVMCRSLQAASALMAAARPAFKNVGLTSFKHGSYKYIVAIWGDEGIDMPLTSPDSVSNFIFNGQEGWLSEQVNERHLRNWQKIERFVNSVRNMPGTIDDISMEWNQSTNEVAFENNGDQLTLPKRFDTVGDVALLHSMPEECTTEEEKEAIGKAIMKRNKAIKVVAVRSANLIGSERAPGMDGLEIIAGTHRSPLITSHAEYGIKCVIDLNQTFFSSRMAVERLRICQQVARGENVLALFCGVGMDAMQIAARTEATVLAVELNPVAIACAERGKELLPRNKSVKCAGAADRLTFIQGDAIDVMKSLDDNSFDRIIAPRPKEGNMDGDLGSGDGGAQYLEALLPLLKDQGECHWYDFAADHELPVCLRTKGTIEKVCKKLSYEMDVIHVAKVGSIAKRQLRICMDFRVIK
jgi:tRNA G37 N-methylase Trm5